MSHLDGTHARATAARQLGGALRGLQRTSGMTLRDLEQRELISDSSLSRYFRGATVPPWAVVRDICRALGADPIEYRGLWEAADGGLNRPAAAPPASLGPAAPTALSVPDALPAPADPSVPTVPAVVPGRSRGGIACRPGEGADRTRALSFAGRRIGALPGSLGRPARGRARARTPSRVGPRTR